MFVNCPSCRGLVATDPATDQPPERCPRCAAPLRDASVADAGHDARSGVAAALSEAFGTPGAGTAPTETHPALDPAARPVISIAHLLQVDPAVALAPEAGAAADAETAPPAAASIPAAAPPPPPTAGRPAPSFARRRRAAALAAAGGRGWWLHAVIVALAVLLGTQWLLADRERLAADPGWRPTMERMCTLLRCSLPPWREPTAFALLERDVRPHPAAAGVLRITASFRNDAAWAQPWPDVVLTLSDIDGRPLAARAFSAEEYLGDAPPSPLLESGQGAVIRMDVIEPGPGAVGFAFDFR